MNIKAVYKDMNAIGNNSILTLARLWKGVMGVLGIVLLASCSETASVPEGDQLYTGQRKIKYENYKASDHFSTTQEEVEAALATEPNGAIFGSSYYRSPFPYRLWIYNAFHTSDEGLGRWIRKTFGKAPVLMSNVNPRLRSQVARELLRARGYFGSYVNYDIITKSNPKKAKIGYTVNLGDLTTIDTLTYVNFPVEAQHLIDSTSAEALVHKGDPFDVSTLDAERTRVSTLLRNNGYFYYQPSYATYLADTLAAQNKAQVKLQYADSLPSQIGRRWYIGHINLQMRRNVMQQLTDSVTFRDYTIVYTGKRTPIRAGVIARDLKMRPGQLYSYNTYQQSVNTLTSKGLFSRVDLGFAPRDTSAACDTLDLTLNCVFDKPYDFSIEANVVGKTTGRVGPGAVMSVVRRNAFRGGEKLSVNLKGSYEWQTGHRADGTSSKFNSYEYGADVSLEMPRLMFVDRLMERVRAKRWLSGQKVKPNNTVSNTLIKASSDVLNRSGYFKRHIVSGELTYTIQPAPNRVHQFSPLILQYEYMQKQTEAFKEIVSQSPYLLISMADQFVPKMRYTFTYQSRSNFRNPIYWQLSVSEASNLLSLGYLASGEKWNKKGKTMFKNPYAQFLKIETDYRKTWQVTDHSQLVGHVNAGVIWSYGNASAAPYSEQFYVGGANSIRAFNVRSIGPGRYYTNQSRLSYMDQTGDIKFQANVEYRPRLFGNLYGALFVDAGNVWALRDDGYREGSKLQMKNLLKDMALGTGVGIRYDLEFFVLRLDWGIGIHVPYKSGFYNMNSFKDSQSLHFAIGYPF